MSSMHGCNCEDSRLTLNAAYSYEFKLRAVVKLQYKINMTRGTNVMQQL